MNNTGKRSFLDETLFETNDPKTVFHKLDQLIVHQKMVGVSRAAVFLIAARECLVYEHPAIGHRVQNMREQGPIKVIDDDDARERASGKGPIAAIFQVGTDNFGVRANRQIGDGFDVSINGNDWVPTFQKKPGVATIAASHIENRAVFGDQRREAAHPGRGLGNLQIPLTLTFFLGFNHFFGRFR